MFSNYLALVSPWEKLKVLWIKLEILPLIYPYFNNQINFSNSNTAPFIPLFL